MAALCNVSALRQRVVISRRENKGGLLIITVLSVQVLFSGDHLASTVVGEWTAKHEDKGDGFLGISRSFNCESNCFHPLNSGSSIDLHISFMVEALPAVSLV